MIDYKQLSLDDIDKEILRELGAPDAYGHEPPPTPKELEKPDAAGAPQTLFVKERPKEMAVFTFAKKLGEYVFVITEKSPKKYRWSIVTRMQNCCMEVLEYLYRANFEREKEPRISYQKRAATALKLMDFYAETARKKRAITIRQMDMIAALIYETERLLNGWVKSSKNL